MLNAILFVHNDAFTDEEITHFLNAHPEIVTWFQVMKGAYMIEATLPANALYAKFKAYAMKNRGVATAIELPTHFFTSIKPELSGVLKKGVVALNDALLARLQSAGSPQGSATSKVR